LWLLFLGRRLFQPRIQSRRLIVRTGLLVGGGTIHSIAERQPYICLELLVTVVLDDFAHPLSTSRKLKSIVRSCICREPVLSVDLFTVCLKTREEIFVIF